jgi:hypothetical protein
MAGSFRVEWLAGFAWNQWQASRGIRSSTSYVSGGKRLQWIGDTLKKVFAPTLDQALTFLDDKLLPATSNAVERGNRRHHKMQKSVYRVQSQVSLEGRIALDMIRESRAENRAQITQVLHPTRRGSP